MNLTKICLTLSLLLIAFVATTQAYAAGATAAPKSYPTVTGASGAPVASGGDSGEPWKGIQDNNQVEIGALGGVGFFDGYSGFTAQGSFAKSLLQNGFITDDISDKVYLEAQAGPWFRSGSTTLMYSLHLRWDFQMNSQWTFYAVGGLGGVFADNTFAHQFEMYPRFGMGTLWSFAPRSLFRVRVELSHEFIGAGVSFPFWME